MNSATGAIKPNESEMSAELDFHHPYTPYAVQETFMQTVYHVLDEGKIGILESPTGTVSVNCSSCCLEHWPSYTGSKLGIAYSYQ